MSLKSSNDQPGLKIAQRRGPVGGFANCIFMHRWWPEGPWGTVEKSEAADFRTRCEARGRPFPRNSGAFWPISASEGLHEHRSQRLPAGAQDFFNCEDEKEAAIP